MTAGELADHKEKIRKVMVDHLTTLGYPDIEPQKIADELKSMWIKLEEAGLILQGMSFQAFCEHANQAYTFWQMRDMLGI